MILTDYYRFVQLPDCKAKTRLDCIISTKSYNEFECLRNKNGNLFVYFGDVPYQFGGDVKKRADKAITKIKNISSVFVPDATHNSATGDVKGTQDALLILHEGNYSQIDVFVARGQKQNRLNVWQNYIAGELHYEIEKLKKSATDEG